MMGFLLSYFSVKKSTKRKSYIMILRGRTMFDPTTRVVDGADPYKIKSEYSK